VLVSELRLLVVKLNRGRVLVQPQGAKHGAVFAVQVQS